jgi:hypothetical protein
MFPLLKRLGRMDLIPGRDHVDAFLRYFVEEGIVSPDVFGRRIRLKREIGVVFNGGLRRRPYLQHPLDLP